MHVGFGVCPSMYSDKQIQQTNTEDDHCNHQAGQCDVVPVTSLITTVAKLQDLHDAIAIHHEQQLHRSHQNFIGALETQGTRFSVQGEQSAAGAPSRPLSRIMKACQNPAKTKPP